MNPTEDDATRRTRIKFCGLSRPEDVDAAYAAGVDAVGFVCHPASPRHVPAGRLPALARAIGPFVTPVLLFVDAAPDDVRRALEAMPDAILQFHGSETAAQCESFGRPWVRAIHLGAGVDLLDCETTYKNARALLVDAPAAGGAVAGGAGRVFDWSLVPGRARRTRPLVLAGGLNAGNVGAAIVAVRPDAVDVSSGIESSRGVKSRSLMTEFVAAVRAADRRLKGEAPA